MSLRAVFLLFTWAFLAFSEMEFEARNTPIKIETEIGVDKKLGDSIDGKLTFVDETGKTVALSQYMGTNPLMIALVYYECPSICGLLMTGTFRALRQMDLKPGKDFTMLFVGIDPDETPELAKKKKKAYLKRYDLRDHASGVHTLTGTSESISALAQQLGFRYRYDENTDQYAHPAMLAAVTPSGKISQYHAGVEFKHKELRLSLVTASGNRIGNPVDHFFLYCFRYDPTTGRYGLIIMNILKLMGLMTIAGILSFIFVLLRLERRKSVAL